MMRYVNCSDKIKILSHNNKVNACWYGGAILSNLGTF